MDHSQNLNCDQHFYSTERDNADILLLEACLNQTEGQKNILEANVVKHERVKAEICDLQLKLDNLQRTMEDKKIFHQQSYNEINQELETTSSKYSQVLSSIEELEQNNHELECSVQSQSSLESQIIEKINKLEISKKRAIECNNSIWDKINNEKECAKSFQRQQTDLETAIASKTTEAQKLRVALTDKEAMVQCQGNQLTELQRQNTSSDRTLQEFTTECQEREAELEAHRHAAPEKLARADHYTDMVRRELSDACAAAAGWKTKGQSAANSHCELITAQKAEQCRAKSILAELSDERCQLVERLADTLQQLKCAVAENCQLTADAKVLAERLACLTSESERLNVRKFSDRLSQMAQCTVFDGQDDKTTRKWNTLESVENEVERLKWACEDRERAIKDAKGKLGDCCTASARTNCRYDY
ncbi:uveal autoantigen with coiled-coil domains and ankyrin repeats-like [Rhopalosiphum maidis]|uniref:uveal autoantigen with coiled-coil domains and ankyrin repeats-like n=1 Tax=Rhopalosiphum maidis TaxID=43146 RepID=UPI000EFE4D2B|nr:uveal autoantigen with coiled-coil domains and ankyrin repeats-like [Rhopalosiphum maidis]